jgi:hypothetical protein
VFGGPLFIIVATATAAVMVAMTGATARTTSAVASRAAGEHFHVLRGRLARSQQPWSDHGPHISFW